MSMKRDSSDSSGMSDDSIYDSDNVSLSSTSEESRSQVEWTVTKILAQAKVAGVQKYLIEWSDFRLCDATWEPAENLSQELLAEWDALVKETGRTTVSGFSIGDWRKAVNADIRAQYAKHEARNRKRTLLGLRHKVLPCSLQEWLDSVQGPDENDDLEPPVKTDETLPDTTPLREEANSGTGSAATGPSENTIVIPQQKEQQTPRPANKFKGNKGSLFFPSRRNRHPPTGPSSSKATDSKSTTAVSNISETRRLSNSLVAGPPKDQSKTSLSSTSANNKAASAGSSKLMLNVFVGGKEQKRRRNVSDAPCEPSASGPNRFFNYRKRWMVEKARRDGEGIRPPAKSPASLPLIPLSASKLLDAGGPVPDEKRDKKNVGQNASKLLNAGGPVPDEKRDKKNVGQNASKLLNAGGPVSDEKRDKKNVGQSASKLLDAGDPLPDGKGDKQKVGRSDLSLEAEPSGPKKKKVRWADDLEQEQQRPADDWESLFISDGEEVPGELQTGTSFPIREHKVAPFASPPPPDTFVPPSPSISENTYKICHFGPRPESFARLGFSGWKTDDKSLWACHLHNQPRLNFSHMCTMRDFGSQMKVARIEDIIVCRGNIEADAESKPFIDLLATRLQVGQLAFVCFLNAAMSISIAIHVPDFLQAGGGPLPLQYFIYLPDPPISDLMLAPLPPVAHQERGVSGAHNFFLGGTFERAFKNGTTEASSQNFFLVFPQCAYQEAVMLSQCLRVSNSSCTIRSSLIPGQWAEFASLDRGNVILHEDAIWVIRSMPRLGSILQNQMRFWEYSCSSLRPKDQDSLPAAPADYRLRPILRSGTVVLITPSFLVSQPEQFYNFLKFFWKNYTHHSTIFRIGKLAVASDMIGWLAQLAIEKAESWSRAGKPDCQGTERAKASEALHKCYMLLRKLMDGAEDEVDSPFIFAPDVLDGNDEQSLVNWFGSWTACQNQQQFRKFYVLGSSAQSETRLSRTLQPVQFTSPAEDTAEDIAESPVETIAENDDSSRIYSNEGPKSHIQLKDTVSYELAEIRNALYDIERKYQSPPYTPLFFYEHPVVMKGPDIISQQTDIILDPDDLDRWFSFFARRFFDYVTNDTSKWPPQFKNTYVGYFYTGGHDQPWNFDTHPQPMIWSPWIAIYRPSQIHLKPWKSMDLLIWDPSLGSRIPDPGSAYEEDLLGAQQDLLHFLEKKTRDRKDALPLAQVWVGPVGEFKNYPRGRDDVDRALRWVDELGEAFRTRLPLKSNALTMRGWKPLQSGYRPPKESPRPSPRPSPQQSPRPSPQQSPRPSPRQSPRPASSVAPRAQQSLPFRVILQPPGTEAMDSDSQEGPCRNFFRDAILGHQGPGPIPFTFQPTLKWYTPQFDMGFGYQHINVLTWQQIFERHGIHDPEKEGARLP
ncbi:hypothetical protein E4U40_000230 [Claviceps sp. LM458 group G5]|nr:hypothetical protein E4U40_000230 [Claviceps sp. LM458 group G5]